MLKKTPWLVLMILAAQMLCSETIEKIQVEGNRKVSRETIQFYMKSREGGVYDAQKLKEDFQSLWATGFFENVRIEEENGSAGKIVRLVLVENPLISAVTYKLSKKVKESDITEKLQGSNILLQPFSYYSPAKVRRVKKLITDMLLEKGYNQAEVIIDEKPENGQVALTVRAEAGYKTRIAGVVFPGLTPDSVSPSSRRSPARTCTTARRSPRTSRKSVCACSRRATWRPRSGRRNSAWSPGRRSWATNSRCSSSASRSSSARATAWAPSPSRATRSFAPTFSRA
jgi:outer membrane protein assembly factor BamA